MTVTLWTMRKTNGFNYCKTITVKDEAELEAYINRYYRNCPALAIDRK